MLLALGLEQAREEAHQGAVHFEEHREGEYVRPLSWTSGEGNRILGWVQSGSVSTEVSLLWAEELWQVPQVL